MRIELTYNREPLSLEVSDDVVVDMYQTKPVTIPVGFEQFKSTFESLDVASTLNVEKLLLIVNDAHRSTPTSEIINWLFALMPDTMANADFLVACGTHLPPDDTQYRKIFGERYDSLKKRITHHDCHSPKNKTQIGVDQFAKPVFLNSQMFEYDQLMIINSVEPHYFAGYTGGRKSFCPGLADFDTIERNHNLANSLECFPTRLEGNPMAEHLENILDLALGYSPLIANTLSLQVVYDSTKTIGALCWGDVRSAFADAVEVAEAMYLNRTDAPYDAVLMEILPPLDNSIYQAQKALENNQMAVKNGGSAFVVSACYDGIGSPHFFKLAENWDAVKNRSKDGLNHFGSHKLSRVNAIGKRIHAGLFSNADSNDVRKVFYEPVDDIQSVLDDLRKHNKLNRMAVVHDAGHVVLMKK